MSKVRGRPFEPGNKFGRGRPKGSRNKKRALLEALLDDHGDALLRKCIVRALQGDGRAMQICVERLLPARRDGHISVSIQSTRTAAEVNAASERVVRAIGSGQITPREGETLSNILESRRRAIETADLASRIEKLEAEAAREANERVM